MRTCLVVHQGGLPRFVKHRSCYRLSTRPRYGTSAATTQNLHLSPGPTHASLKMPYSRRLRVHAVEFLG